MNAELKHMFSFTISYEPLWTTLSAMNLKKIDLVKNGIITSAALKKIQRGDPVSLNVVGSICVGLGVGIEDVVEIKTLGTVKSL